MLPTWRISVFSVSIGIQACRLDMSSHLLPVQRSSWVSHLPWTGFQFYLNLKHGITLFHESYTIVNSKLGILYALNRGRIFAPYFYKSFISGC